MLCRRGCTPTHLFEVHRLSALALIPLHLAERHHVRWCATVGFGRSRGVAPLRHQHAIVHHAHPPCRSPIPPPLWVSGRRASILQNASRVQTGPERRKGGISNTDAMPQTQFHTKHCWTVCLDGPIRTNARGQLALRGTPFASASASSSLLSCSGSPLSVICCLTPAAARAIIASAREPNVSCLPNPEPSCSSPTAAVRLGGGVERLQVSANARSDHPNPNFNRSRVHPCLVPTTLRFVQRTRLFHAGCTQQNMT
jgi:hypothetical protein